MKSVFFMTVATASPLVVGYCFWRAINTARTAPGATAWTVFLLSAPWISVPLFLIFGQRKVKGYRAAWRKSHEIIQKFAAYRKKHSPVFHNENPLKALEKIGGLPFTVGNNFDLLVNGKQTFEAICKAIDTAEKYVCIQFYIIRDDGLGRRLADHLIAAARRGVTVRVVYDGVGSYFLSAEWRNRLSEVGIHILDPRSLRGPTAPWHLNFRNHRKTVIIDGRIAFIGGHNVGDEYLGLDPKIGHWRDTHLSIRGPVVTQAQLIFAEDWNWVSGENLEDALDWSPNIAESENKLAALVPTGPGDPIDSGALMFFIAIIAAKKRIWIASPYFIPDFDIQSALIAAALAGKDVRLILPLTCDHYLPWLAARAFFDEMTAAGVKIFCYRNGFMHQKVILIDDNLAAVGTANLDSRSFRLNFESMVFVQDKEFATKIKKMLETDFTQSLELQKKLQDMPWWIKIGAPIARLMAPVL